MGGGKVLSRMRTVSGFLERILGSVRFVGLALPQANFDGESRARISGDRSKHRICGQSFPSITSRKEKSWPRYDLSAMSREKTSETPPNGALHGSEEERDNRSISAYGPRVISFENVTGGYAEQLALEGISLEIPPGEFLGIIGPNGAGKTTIFKLILGLIEPMAGSVEVLGYTGQEVKKARPRIGYLSQREEIDPQSLGSVLDVVLMGRYSRIGLFRRVRSRDREIALRALEQVQMSDFASHPIGHLSGGQQQRVLVARTLAQEPEILLLDEPTMALDVATQQELIRCIGEIHRALGLTVLFITHNVNTLIGLADRVLYLNRRLYAIGPPEEILTEEMLTRMYGHEVAILTRPDGRTCVIVGDSHA